MRIIAGEFRRRVLMTPKDAEVTRPIPDRVKESVFSLLRGHCEGATVFDGFAGTGAIGLEAISRGARHCVFVERDREIAEILQGNIDALECGDRCDVVRGDALGAGALARALRPLTLAFLDPPYPLVREAIGFRRVMAQVQNLVGLLSPEGYVVLRTPWPLEHPVVVAPVEGEVAEPAREASRKDKRGMVKRGRSWRRYADAMDPTRVNEHLSGKKRRRGDAETAHSAEPPEAEGDEEGAEGLKVKEKENAGPMVAADLTIANAVGPETHVYGAMAVHLYGLKKAVGAVE